MAASEKDVVEGQARQAKASNRDLRTAGRKPGKPSPPLSVSSWVEVEAERQIEEKGQGSEVSSPFSWMAVAPANPTGLEVPVLSAPLSNQGQAERKLRQEAGQ